MEGEEAVKETGRDSLCGGKMGRVCVSALIGRCFRREERCRREDRGLYISFRSWRLLVTVLGDLGTILRFDDLLNGLTKLRKVFCS